MNFQNFSKINLIKDSHSYFCFCEPICLSRAIIICFYSSGNILLLNPFAAQLSRDLAYLSDCYMNITRFLYLKSTSFYSLFLTSSMVCCAFTSRSIISIFFLFANRLVLSWTLRMSSSWSFLYSCCNMFLCASYFT